MLEAGLKEGGLSYKNGYNTPNFVNPSHQRVSIQSTPPPSSLKLIFIAFSLLLGIMVSSCLAGAGTYLRNYFVERLSPRRSSSPVMPATMSADPSPSADEVATVLISSARTEPNPSSAEIKPDSSIDEVRIESSPSTYDALCDLLNDNFVVSKHGDRSKEEHYLPEGRLDGLITEEVIGKELSQGLSFLQPSERAQFIKAVAQNAKKVFTTAILSQVSAEKIYYLINNLEITDKKLPISNRNPSLVRSLGGWRAHQFWDNQWKFLVPVFREDKLIYHLESQHILPFYELKNAPNRGTFGVVSEVMLHANHQKYSEIAPGELRIAVKEIVAQSMAPKNDQSSLKDVREAWETEATALDKLSEVKHENLIQCIAAIDKADKYYFLFPWADGGSLQDFWENLPNPDLTQELVKNIIVQMRGLSAALNTLHTYKGGMTNIWRPRNSDDISAGGGIRHGDLKPPNILRFEPRDNSDIGTLKIADMGLAKHHEVNTRLRKNATVTRFGSTRYEPPEAKARLGGSATSRLYDVWSMGCIMLELLIWLLYGNNELVKFVNFIREDLNDDPTYFILTEEAGRGKTAKVHPLVTEYIKALAREPACAANTALGDLLRVVQEKLLVVELPPISTRVFQDGPVSITSAEPTETTNGPYRVTAATLLDSLDNLIRKCDANASYLCTERNQSSLFIKHTAPSSSLHPKSAQEMIRRPREGSVTESSPQVATQMRGNFDIEVWNYEVDNGFAVTFLDKLAEAAQPLPFPQPANADQLCKTCLGLDFWVPKFHITDDLLDLKKRAKTCRFCEMRWDVSSHLESTENMVRFDRVGSVIKMNESDPPVFSICRSNRKLPSPYHNRRVAVSNILDRDRFRSPSVSPDWVAGTLRGGECRPV
ncbi:hypothetical protein F5Y14DRAFT_437785 [Nemania sp. NC0429]|nr:hypothetical protein F5Y14DRAFT_437785 [Nemania sp. NC0429]